MKIRIHLTPALTIALLCAVGWFAFWLLAFRPAPLRSALPSIHPEWIRLPADDKILNKITLPTLFALPSAEGFSGQFIKDKIAVERTPKKPDDPTRYLSHGNDSAPGIRPSLLLKEAALPKNALPLPGVLPRVAVPPETGARFFLSPELKGRASELPQLTIADPSLPENIRVNLAIRTDGTVKSAFFENPVTNVALLSAVRQLQFKPAQTETDGWIDIRFAREGAE